LVGTSKATTTQQRAIKALFVENKVRKAWTGIYHLMVPSEIGGEVSLCGHYQWRSALLPDINLYTKPWLKIKHGKCKHCMKIFNKTRNGK
jgi:hypothetical protein